MSDTLLRQWLMLGMIPRYPRQITTAQLRDRLEEHDYPVDVRTVQRDLNYLSAIFALLGDGARPQGWSWQPNAQVFAVPSLDPSLALAFRLAETYLKPIVPPRVFNTPAPGMANGVLAGPGGQSLGSWLDKVRVIPRGQPLRAPRIAEGVLETICEALLQERCLTGRYRSRDAEEEKDYGIIHPLGLVLRDTIVYLVGTLWHFDDVRQLALHRFRSVELLDRTRQVPEGFNLDVYIRRGEFEYPEGGEITLKALFDPGAAYHLSETPLSEDQQLTETEAKRVQLTATVKDTAQLRWWLLGFGEGVEVLAPLSLRQAMAETAAAMYERYLRTVPS
jgi:predicted DNA-binding transcriptional regulator YafY